MVKGTKIQEELKTEIYNNIKKYELEIERMKRKIIEINNVIVKECVNTYGEHYFEHIRDCGIYGDTYLICKKCRYEK